MADLRSACNVVTVGNDVLVREMQIKHDPISCDYDINSNALDKNF